MPHTTTTLERVNLKDSPIFSSFAVKNLDAAREFYGRTLGLDVRKDEMGMLEIHPRTGSPVSIYPKDDHRPAVFTVLNLPVKDLDATVDSLIAAGVPMEHYDGTNGPKTNAKGISEGEGPRIAWFRDPDGNILSVLESFSR